MNIWKHFKTITHHKVLVAKGCFKVGLYKQGLLHDMSKYSPTEFWVGAKYYQGDRSPNNAEREDIGYSSAWLHHKGRNKHHYEYWIDYSMQALPGGMAPVPMPDRYIAEMIMDRIAASKVYMGDQYTDRSPLDTIIGAQIRHLSILRQRQSFCMCWKCWQNRAKRKPFNLSKRNWYSINDVWTGTSWKKRNRIVNKQW